MTIDIAPPPLGDGIVDTVDLELFMHHWSDENLKAGRQFSASVDFNNDKKVDIKDLQILIEGWEQNVPVLDIAPEPSGDGIINVNDLEVLLNFWDTTESTNQP